MVATAKRSRWRAPYRDSLLEELPPTGGRIHANRVTIRNSSGVVGVCRVVREESSGARYEFWQATWSPAPGAAQDGQILHSALR